MVRIKENYKDIVAEIEKFEIKSDRELHNELVEIIESWKPYGIKMLSDLCGVKRQALYNYKKECKIFRPSFEAYIRIKNIGKFSV